MLLTLHVAALRSYLLPSKKKDGQRTLTLTDVPRFAREELNLFGLTLSTDLLAGADGAKLDALRDAADKASCPCLVLAEPEPQRLGASSETVAAAAVDRITRVTRAASRLGCNAASVAINAPNSSDAMTVVAERLRRVLQAADRLEMNILLRCSEGLTAEPERVTDLIKKVGGFRIGTAPDFETASKAPDPIHHLRRLTPYAAAVTASAVTFKNSKKPPGFVHEAYDLALYAQTVAAVGYTGTLAIDYRGEEDPVTGITRARTLLEPTSETEATDE